MSDTLEQWPATPLRLPHQFAAVADREIDLYEGKAMLALGRLQSSREIADKVGLRQHALYFLLDKAGQVRVELATKRYRNARRGILLLERHEQTWAAALGCALHGCLLAATSKQQEAIAKFEAAVGLLDSCELQLYAFGAQFHLARLTHDAALESAALDALRRCGVAMPTRMISSLLPVVP